MSIPTRAAAQVPVIDRDAHRTQLAVAGLLMVAAAASGQAWPLWLGAVLFAISATRFPETSPIVRLWNATGARVRPPRLLIDARPARVMVISTVPTMTALALLLPMGSASAVRLVLLALGAGFVVEAFVGRCVTCETYSWLAKKGLVKPHPPLTDGCVISTL